jgi:hypothetical protein
MLKIGQLYYIVNNSYYGWYNESAFKYKTHYDAAADQQRTTNLEISSDIVLLVNLKIQEDFIGGNKEEVTNVCLFYSLRLGKNLVVFIERERPVEQYFALVTEE